MACVGLLRAAVVRSDSGDTWEVDASAVRQFDSSALAVLLEARREGLGLGKKLIVVNWPAPLSRLAAVYGVQALLAG